MGGCTCTQFFRVISTFPFLWVCEQTIVPDDVYSALERIVLRVDPEFFEGGADLRGYLQIRLWVPLFRLRCDQRG